MQSVDTLIYAAHVVPMEPRVVLKDHAVAVTGGEIVAVMPAAKARTQFEARQEVRLDRHVLMPGLVNLHCHAAMSLLRGLGDDLPLMRWLQERIWPAEARHVDDAFTYDGSLLAMAEMLRGGVTCVNDMYFFPEATARAALAIGMRASLGVIAIEFPSAYASDASGYLAKGLATRDAYSGEELLGFTLAPHAAYTVGDEMLSRMAVLAEELDLPVHIHVHETRDEIAQSEAQHGVRPLERLRRLGLVGPRLIAVHAVHLEEGELDLLAREGASVAHCPSSNLKLASGIAPVAGMRQRGITVGVGTDSAASNNRLDVFTEMRTAALLAKGASGDAQAVGAFDALAMATIDAARAIGRDRETGSISPGKRADIIALDFGTLESQPCYDPISHLVYVAGRENVSHVWVDGIARVAEGQLLGIDTALLGDKIAWWAQRIRAA